MNEREIAVFTLVDMFNEGAYNNIMLRKTLNKYDDLTKTQKAFITEVVNGTLRNLMNIDYIINLYSKTKTNKMKPFILNNIRASVYQILYMDKVPVSAACNEAVKLAKKKHFNQLSGFVNGVLRAIARNKDCIEYPKDRLEEISIKYSYPTWLLKYWLEEMNIEQLEEICKAFSNSPKVSLCVNTSKISKEELVKELEKENVAVDANTLLDNSIYINRTSNIANLEAYKKGYFHIMDESSILAAKILSPEGVVVDTCAAPGGKSFAMAEFMKNKGVIFSRDVYEHKLELINEGAKRLGLENIKPQLFNSMEVDSETKADYVLVDAPCSGFGLVRKKPDIKYNKQFEDIDELVKIQRKILEASSQLVKVNGVLVYSTCTISHKENIDNVRWFCKEFGFSLESIEKYLPEKIKCETAKDGYIRLLPNLYGTDGFFIARMRKNG